MNYLYTIMAITTLMVFRVVWIGGLVWKWSERAEKYLIWSAKAPPSSERGIQEDRLMEQMLLRMTPAFHWKMLLDLTLWTPSQYAGKMPEIPKFSE